MNTDTQNDGSRSYAHAWDSVDFLTVPEDVTFTVQDINFYALSEAAAWLVELAIYNCDSAGNPSTSVVNADAVNLDGPGPQLFTADLNTQLSAGTYQMAWKVVTSSRQWYYVVGTVDGVTKRGRQLNLSEPWEPSGNHVQTGKTQFWCNCLEVAQGGGTIPDKGPFGLERAADGKWYASNPGMPDEVT